MNRTQWLTLGVVLLVALGAVCALAWSPDGMTLAFFTISNGLHSLFTAGYDGGLRSLVSDIEPVRELLGPPAWSASGNRIAFRAKRADGGVELYLAWPYGGAIRLACSE